MANEKTYLKPGDIILADNVVLMYDGQKYILTVDGLTYANKFIIDDDSELECPIEYEITKENIKPYYQASPMSIQTQMKSINEEHF
jgi:hypothetical protein